MRVVLETPHLLIRTWQESDLQPYATLIGEETEGSRYHSGKPVSRAENDIWRYQVEQDRWGWSKWAVIYKENNQLIGCCGFSPYHDEVEIGWRFLREYLGRGLVLEAMEATAAFGLETLGFKKIISFTSPGNQFAQDVMRSVGMSLERLEGWSNCTVARYSLSHGERL